MVCYQHSCDVEFAADTWTCQGLRPNGIGSSLGIKMSVEKIDTVVIGGGQSGVAMSERLGEMGIPHIVLERARIAERWRSERWDLSGRQRPGMARSFP